MRSTESQCAPLRAVAWPCVLFLCHEDLHAAIAQLSLHDGSEPGSVAAIIGAMTAPSVVGEFGSGVGRDRRFQKMYDTPTPNDTWFSSPLNTGSVAR